MKVHTNFFSMTWIQPRPTGLARHAHFFCAAILLGQKESLVFEIFEMTNYVRTANIACNMNDGGPSIHLDCSLYLKRLSVCLQNDFMALNFHGSKFQNCLNFMGLNFMGLNFMGLNFKTV